MNFLTVTSPVPFDLARLRRVPERIRDERWDPPLTKEEAIAVYRAVRDGATLLLRCHFCYSPEFHKYAIASYEPQRIQSMSDNGKCSFLHAAFEDDWTRCPYPEQIKRYRVSNTVSGIQGYSWYCDEGAEEARNAGYVLDLSPQDSKEKI